MQTVAVVVEQAEDGGFAAHVPDLPTILVADESLDRVLHLAREAVEFYFAEQAETGLEPPEQLGVAYNISFHPDAA